MISIFFVFTDFIKILKSYNFVVFFVFLYKPSCCLLLLLPLNRTVVAFLVANTEVGIEAAELPNCSVNRAVATVQQLILNSSSLSKSAFKSIYNLAFKIRYNLVFK